VNGDEVRAIVFDALHEIAPDADPTTLAPDADFRTALDLDSFDVLQLLLALHRRLGVEVPDAVAGELTTLDRIVEYLLQRLPAGARPASPSGGSPAGR
jgi:acyl carrier protein